MYPIRAKTFATLAACLIQLGGWYIPACHATFFDWLFPCRNCQTPVVVGYAPVNPTTVTAFPAATCPTNTCPSAVPTVGIIPQTSFRTVLSPVPVTSFQPVQVGTATWMQAQGGLEWQARRVPVPTFLSMPHWTASAPTVTPTTVSTALMPVTTFSPVTAFSPSTMVAPMATSCPTASCSTQTCPTVTSFSPVSSVVSDWQPVSTTSCPTTAGFGGSACSLPSTSNLGYATASDFSPATSSPTCSCEANSGSAIYSPSSPSTSGSMAPQTSDWSPATDADYERYQRENGRSRESDNPPDLRHTPSPAEENQTSRLYSRGNSLKENDRRWTKSTMPVHEADYQRVEREQWVPLRPSHESTLERVSEPTVTPVVPIPDPRASDRQWNQNSTPARPSSQGDGLLDRRTIHTAARFDAVPIRWQAAKAVITNRGLNEPAKRTSDSTEGDWRPLAANPSW